jgi:CO/xanthine dehydrogenase Mo-binding subunit
MLRREGLSKLTGAERYVDDLQLDDFLWGATVRSPAPRGRIADIRFGEGVDWSEFVVVDHTDIPGLNAVYLMEYDQPALAPGYVRHVHEPVLLIAHRSRAKLRRAVRRIDIVVLPEPPALDFRVEPRPELVQYGNDNVLKDFEIDKGDVEQALAAAPLVVEGSYETGAQEHVYLETQGMLAYLEGDVLVIKGSMQCPYYVVKALCPALGLAEEQVRVVQTPTGGGFGGKEEFPSMVALHAGLLALKARKPVKIIYDRTEDMVATTKRHPSLVRHRTGVDSNGRLLAQDIELVLDGGAYVTLTPVVLSRAIIHAAGSYHCENVRIRGRAMFTNSVPYGAFRGFGNPQAHFAVERHMDVVAHTLRMDPVELRRINLIRDGQTTATGQIIRDGVEQVEVLNRALALSDFERRRREHWLKNSEHRYIRRGIGVAAFYHGAGFTGSGEVMLDSRLHLEGHADGSVEILCANTEMGQGQITVFVQLAADRLGYPPANISIAQPDTHRVPDSGPTVGSRTAMVVGLLVEKACDDLRRRLGLDENSMGNRVRDAIVAWHDEHPDERLLGKSRYEPPADIHWDEENYRGDAYGTYGWGSQVAEVEVDLRTFEVSVVDFVSVQEVGKVLNETLARGQIQGGVAQGISWALLEDCVYRDGALQNGQLTNYIIPTSGDLPPIRVEFLEVPYAHGAQGAKGIGELPLVGAAPAVLNAVAAAVGRQPTEIPLTPERLMALLSNGDATGSVQSEDRV